MEPSKLFISSNIIVENKFLNGSILVSKGGKILKILSKTETGIYRSNNKDIEVIDVGENVIMPGIIDSHVHVNEPGRTDWEGYETATKAAAAGGITTIVDMPLNSNPPTTTLNNFREKLNSTKDKIFVDVAFWGGVIPGNQNELISLVKAGVVGFKCFMCPSGIDEFPFVSEKDIEIALQHLEKTDSVLAFHAEIDEHIPPKGDPTLYDTFLKTRPPSMEVKAVATVIALAKNHNVRTHIVHVSAAEVVPLIADAKKRGINLTAETCHHYLNFKSEDIPNKATQYKCTPPIRDLKNQQLLWEAIKNGIIDMVVSDHSPCTPDLKNLGTGDFLTAWGGISSLQFGLSLFWTQLKNHGLSIFDINKYMTHMPAKLTRLSKTKGAIATNLDADFVIWDPHAIIQIEEGMIQHKNKLTPYLGKKLYGKVLKTVVRGNIVYEDGKPFSHPSGKLLINENANN